MAIDSRSFKKFTAHGVEGSSRVGGDYAKGVETVGKDVWGRSGRWNSESASDVPSVHQGSVDKGYIAVEEKKRSKLV